MHHTLVKYIHKTLLHSYSDRAITSMLLAHL